jgi:pimeloyl-ACP methyl ester carboxylesterase
MADRTIRLSDGRTLGYAEYGDPSGRPVIYWHGGLSCALDVAFADDWCRENGVRILAPDRPGIRASSPLPGYGLVNTASDVVSLADRLEIGRFALAGWSAGGPHAIASASRLGDRVTAVATIGSTAPRHEADLGLRFDRAMFATVRHAPGLSRLLVRIARRTSDASKEAQTREAVRSQADRRVIDSLPPGTLASWMNGATSAGPRGILDDYMVTGSDWAPIARTVPASAPVHLFQGAEDHLVPPAHAEALARLIPGARLHLIPSAGHFLLFEHLAEVMATLGPGGDAGPGSVDREPGPDV